MGGGGGTVVIKNRVGQLGFVFTGTHNITLKKSVCTKLIFLRVISINYAFNTPVASAGPISCMFRGSVNTICSPLLPYHPCLVPYRPVSSPLILILIQVCPCKRFGTRPQEVRPISEYRAVCKSGASYMSSQWSNNGPIMVQLLQNGPPNGAASEPLVFQPLVFPTFCLEPPRSQQSTTHVSFHQEDLPPVSPSPPSYYFIPQTTVHPPSPSTNPGPIPSSVA